MAIKDDAPQQNGSISALLGRGSECSFNILGTQYVEVLNLHFQRSSGELRLFDDLRSVGFDRTADDGNAGELGNDLLEKLEPFAAQLRGEVGQSGEVSSRSRQTGDEPAGNRIAVLREDNGNRGCCFLGGTRYGGSRCDDDVHFETH